MFFKVLSHLSEISQRIFRVALLFICQGTSKAIICVNPSLKVHFHKMWFMQRIILRQQSSSNFVARCALQFFAFVLTVFHTQLVYIIMRCFHCQHLFFAISTFFDFIVHKPWNRFIVSLAAKIIISLLFLFCKSFFVIFWIFSFLVQFKYKTAFYLT